jgi:hypothetical protein
MIGLGLSIPEVAVRGRSVLTDTWNPLDKTSTLSVSSGNLTITSGGAEGVDQVIRSNTYRSSGLVHAEFTVTNQQSPGLENIAVGFATAAFPTDGSMFLGGNDDGTAVGVWTDGSVWFGDYYTPVFWPNDNLAAQSNGTVFAIEYRFSDKKLFFKNVTRGTHWNDDASADPTTGVGGIDVSGISADPLFLAGDIEINGDALTINTGGSPFAAAPSANFGPWYQAGVSAAKAIVVCDGDSYTHGQTGNTGWPGGLAATLNPMTTVVNVGTAQTSASQLVNFSSVVAPLFLQAFPIAPKIYVTVPSTDDRSPVTLAQMEANAQAIVNLARAAGAEVVIGTLPVFNVSDVTFTLQPSGLAAYNAALLGLAGLRATFDVSGTALGNPANLTNATYFDQSDPIPHPSTSAYNTIWGPLAATAINSLL